MARATASFPSGFGSHRVMVIASMPLASMSRTMSSVYSMRSSPMASKIRASGRGRGSGERRGMGDVRWASRRAAAAVAASETTNWRRRMRDGTWGETGAGVT